jgi:hypothetical protein
MMGLASETLTKFTQAVGVAELCPFVDDITVSLNRRYYHSQILLESNGLYLADDQCFHGSFEQSSTEDQRPTTGNRYNC